MAMRSAPLFVALWLLSLNAAAQVHRCTDSAGKIVYQQRPCAVAGVAIDVSNPNIADAPRQSVSVAPPIKAQPAPTRESTPRDPLASYRRPGLGLIVGMGIRGVVEAWGLPVDVRTERNYTFMHWCDMRMVMLVDDLLEAWDAPFPDSLVGASLYRYGSPWITAAQRWGSDRKIIPYSGPLLGRGETQKWTDLRWVVTDSHGNIVGWCDAAEHRVAVRPPAFNPPWDSATR